MPADRNSTPAIPTRQGQTDIQVVDIAAGELWERPTVTVAADFNIIRVIGDTNEITSPPSGGTLRDFDVNFGGGLRPDSVDGYVFAALNFTIRSGTTGLFLLQVATSPSQSGTATVYTQIATVYSDEDELITSGSSDDYLYGAGGDDYFLPSTGLDIYEGGEGLDTIDYADSSAAVSVYLNGTSYSQGGLASGHLIIGVEYAIGSNFDDTLWADEFGSILDGGAGDDTLNGGSGFDILIGGTGADALNGGDGFDYIDYFDSNAGVTVNLQTGVGSGGDAEGDTYTSIEDVGGSNFDDVITGVLDGNFFGGSNLYGEAGNDTLIGGNDRDELHGGAGADILDGRGGTGDSAEYRESDAGVTVNLETGVGSGGHAEGDQLSNIEKLVGSEFDDTFIGDEGRNIFEGLGGNDTFIGGGGTDRVIYSLIENPDAVLIEYNADGSVTVDATADGRGVDTLIGISDVQIGNSVMTLERRQTLSDDDDIYENTSDVAQTITGLGGQDSITTGSGADILFGNAGSDTLIGNGGNDVLYGDISQAADLSVASIEGQVYRAYQAVFDRAPDLGGYTANVTNILFGIQTQEDLVTNFVNSAEFELTYGDLDNQSFIEQLYQNVLNRSGDAGGIASFTGALDSETLTRADVVIEFTNTPEFVALMAVPSAAFAQSAAGIHPDEATVFRIYQAVFDRAPDAGGFTANVDALQGNATTVEAITASFVDSAEFQLTYGDLSIEAFVEALYTNVLPGNTDQAGRAAFANRIENDESYDRADMVTDFVNSPEFVSRQADAAQSFVATIYADANDTLDGGAGDDVLFGGRGEDIFIYDSLEDGADVILDFTVGQDVLSIAGDMPFEAAADLIALATQVGANTVFDFDFGNRLTLENVTLSDLTDADFGLDTTAAEKIIDVPVAEDFSDAADTPLLIGEEPDWAIDALI